MPADAPQLPPGLATYLIVSPNASRAMGGEALKVLQYFEWLLAAGLPAHLVTHGRCRSELQDSFPAGCLHFLDDDPPQRALWRSRALRPLLGPYFHRQAAAWIARNWPDRTRTLLHYVCPISPLEPRFPPPGYRCVVGPLNGAIDYPPPLRHRAHLGERLHTAAYGPAERLLRRRLARERTGAVLLVSGGERTRDVLSRTGGSPRAVIDVLDAGIAPEPTAPVPHQGVNGRFHTCARLIGWKGIDLAIRAVARSGPAISLDVIGDGPARPALGALASACGAADRVRFRGWLDHPALAAERAGFRGLVFPSLREANGIAMQEAMLAGTPVIALRWGGPELLADDRSAILLEPGDEPTLVAGLAAAMERLAHNPLIAQAIADRARVRAATFAWDRVGPSWLAASRAWPWPANAAR